MKKSFRLLLIWTYCTFLVAAIQSCGTTNGSTASATSPGIPFEVDLQFAVNLDQTITEVRKEELKAGGVEEFKEGLRILGYPDVAHVANESGVPVYFHRETENYQLNSTFYYALPDSHIFAKTYVWDKSDARISESILRGDFQKAEMPKDAGLIAEYERMRATLTRDFGSATTAIEKGVQTNRWKVGRKVISLEYTEVNIYLRVYHQKQ